MVYTEYISEEYHKNSKLVIITFKIKCFIFYLQLRNSFEENCKSFKRTFSPNLSTITSYLNSTEFGILFCPNAIATTDWRTFGCFPLSRGNRYLHYSFNIQMFCGKMKTLFNIPTSKCRERIKYLLPSFQYRFAAGLSNLLARIRGICKYFWFWLDRVESIKLKVIPQSKE